MKPLYEISKEYQKVIALIENCDEILPEHLEMLGELETDAKSKIVNVGAYIKNLEEIDRGMENYISSMLERQKKINKKINSLKEYLKFNMELLDLKEVKTEEFDIKIRENNYALDILDESLIPKNYYKERISVSLDRQQLIKDLKDHIGIDGVQFIKTKSISVK